MEKKVYNHIEIEKKWQSHWEKNKTFKTENDTSKPKYYVLDMFPYPSGSGLHVGHVVGYTATDILARYKRSQGFNVLHPMGWDSFGLPAEQYAIRTGTHPAETTEANINNFRKQLKALGFSYDWDREFATSDPKYYKWTQWLFTKLYEKGLAYEAEMYVNFCPALGTVLANEEVENGCSKEGGHPVKRRPLRQWVLKITAYADRLLKDLDLLDWPEGLKKLQTNWIGRSEGCIIDFVENSTKEAISVFTTCPHTLFGCSFIVLSPEHPLISKITNPQQKEAVDTYCHQAAFKSDLDRTELNKEKNGVFTGAYAINPANEKHIPIWIADYVLIGYGTGAVMAVPAHDERDFLFAQKYELPILPVIDPSIEKPLKDGTSPETIKMEVLKGGRCWPGEGIMVQSSHAGFSLNGQNIVEAISSMVARLEQIGKGKKSVNYKLRDWLFSRQRYWGEPFPILHFPDGTRRVLDLDELPLCPPELRDFKPAESGESPLSKCKDWIEITDPKTGKKAVRESNTMPQWAGSCWYYLRFCDPLNEMEAWDKKIESYWMPVDMYVGGVEHAVLHLLYARFWHKVLYDCGLVSTLEPFKTLRNQGMVTARSFQKQNGSYVAPEDTISSGDTFTHRQTGETLRSQIDKMSKSKLNGVTPDDIIGELGADSIRLYEMFMGPLDKEKVWSTDAVNGCRRFLTRFHDIVLSDKVCTKNTEAALKLGHRLVNGVCQDVENLQFNTAIAKMMEFINDLTKLTEYPKDVLNMACVCLSWFAPHLAEELWEVLGHHTSISAQRTPNVNPIYLQDDVTTYVIQINGKLRGQFELPKDCDQEYILKLAKADDKIARYLTGEIKKVIFVPNKLLNVVVKE